MAALTSLFLLALQAPPLGDLPLANREGVVDALVMARFTVGRIGTCAEELPDRSDLQETYHDLSDRLHEASDEADGLYPGIDITDEMANRTFGRPPGCDDASLDDLVADAQSRLQTAEAMLGADTAPRGRGLWLGTLRLCGARVEGVEAGESEFAGESPVIVRFSLAFAPRVRALTAAFVSRRLPIVLDGRIVVRPTVNEPVSHAISITSLDGTSVEQIRRAAATPC